MFVELNNISKSFGNVEVLKNLNLSIEKGLITGIIGPSGGGKSTLLKLIGKINEPDSGLVKIPEETKIGLMFQEGALFDSLTVLDNISFPLTNGKVPVSILKNKTKDKVCEKSVDYLKKVGLEDAWSKYPAQLSGGMRRRLSLARSLISNPQLTLLDDPTAGLDPIASSVIMDLIRSVHEEMFMTTIVASHDLRRLFPICDVIIALFDGQIIFKGTIEDLKKSKLENLINFVNPRYNLAA